MTSNLKKTLILVTGANGEVGHGLIPKLSQNKDNIIISVDLKAPDAFLKAMLSKYYEGSVTDYNLISELFRKYKFNSIFHLASILSTGGEKNPDKAQYVNSQGTANLLRVANERARSDKRIIKFIFPSSIAAYGIPNLSEKNKFSKITENQYNSPITMYGINKLYCEMLGVYYSKNYNILEGNDNLYLDFRCVRFPGIISALTIPSGGTSDYGPEMIHAAAQGKKYDCFVRPDTQIPFMVMPDAISALLMLSNTDRKKLHSYVYNVSSFTINAKGFEKMVRKSFPKSAIDYKVDKNRQKIVDSWPMDVNDSNARNDWGWKAEYDLGRSFKKYLIPEIKKLY